MTSGAAAPPLTLTQADAIRQAARDGAPDRYLAALLAPRSARDDLITLAAFAAETEKIGRQVHEAYLAEIRLQWWRDTLCSSEPAIKSGHPVADAFADVVVKHQLPLSALEEFFDASTHRLFAEPPADDSQLALAITMTERTLFAFSSKILGGSESASNAELIDHCAQAYGLAQLALKLPYELAARRLPVPLSYLSDAAEPDWRVVVGKLAERARSHLVHARPAYSSAPDAVKSALLPAALVEPYLRVVSRTGHDPAHDLAGIAPLTRAWRLAKCYALGRI